MQVSYDLGLAAHGGTLAAAVNGRAVAVQRLRWPWVLGARRPLRRWVQGSEFTLPQVQTADGWS